MSSLGVVPEQLESAAVALTSSAEIVERFWTERDAWLDAGRSLGSDRIRRALAGFSEEWAVALRIVTNNVAELAASLVDAADRYVETDARV